jgi:phospholipid/cholesterol/gamma-HCH transport system substrate-binding protein
VAGRPRRQPLEKQQPVVVLLRDSLGRGDALHNRGLQIKVGILVLVSLGILGAFIFALGHLSAASGYSVKVDFNFVGSLAEGAPVKVSGIKVGKVKKVEFMAGQYDAQLKRRVYVRLTLWVETRAREAVRTDSSFYINTQGVLGEQYVEITPGNRDDPKSKPVPPGDIRKGEDPPRMDLIVSRLYTLLETVTDLLVKERHNLVKIIQNGTKSLDTLDRILTENRSRIPKLLDDADRLLTEATTLVQSANRGLDGGHQLRNTLANVNRVTASLARELDPLLNKTKKALDGAAELAETIGPEQRKKIHQLLDRVLEITRKADGLTADAAKIVADVRAGRGTAGALVMDREVYEDVKEMVRDLKRNPWKFFWKE